MSDRDRLRAAIYETAAVLQQTVQGCDEFHAGGLVLDAARRWATLTEGHLSDELVEAGAKALHDQAAPEFDVEEIPWADCHELYQMDRRLAARTVLNAAVEEITK